MNAKTLLEAGSMIADFANNYPQAEITNITPIGDAPEPSTGRSATITLEWLGHEVSLLIVDEGKGATLWCAETEIEVELTKENLHDALLEEVANQLAFSK